MRFHSIVHGCAFFLIVLPASAAEVFEVGPLQASALPGGKEADGIVGDFVLRNDLVEAVISHNAPQRRADMVTYYGESGTSPGCLYDLTLRGADNDQITIFGPLDQRKDVSFVRIVEGAPEGSAMVETVVSEAINEGIFKRHVYELQDGWQGVRITTTVKNTTGRVHEFKSNDAWKSFSKTGVFEGIRWGDAVDPADKSGYAYDWLEISGSVVPPGTVRLKQDEAITFTRFLAVGRSPAEALGVVAKHQGVATSEVSYRIQDPDKKAIATAVMEILYPDGEETKRLPAYPNAEGIVRFALPKGKAYEVEWRDHGRPTVKGRLDSNNLGEGLTEMTAASAIAFDIRNESGKTMPCKAQFIGIEPTKSPDLGPNNRAHGCKDQYHSESGRFRVQLDPGRYRIVVTRGIEYSHLAKEIELEAGETITISGTLKRLVDTRGWVSADFHNHSTPSGDNTCNTNDRLINIAAEHIEFAPTTEHNRIYDWRPHIDQLGLTEEIQTVPGIELTGRGAHFNAFPYEPDPLAQDGGAPVWQKDPRLNAITLRELQGQEPDRWVQINHPDMVENFIDRDGDGRVDGGYLTLGQLIDGIETQNYLGGDILLGVPCKIVEDSETLARQIRYLREFIWLQLLNQGHRVWGVCVADAHTVHGNGVGSWRNYIPSSSDRPAEIDWREMARNAKAGRLMVTSGPYLEVATSDGTIAGGTTRATAGVDLKVKVQCTDWIDIDRVQILVNGAQRPDVNFTRATHPEMFEDSVVKFNQTVRVPLSQDSHLIVVAYHHGGTLKTGYGSSTQAGMHPCAYNNPIFIDVDGGGFQPNGDTLGHPLPVQNMTIGEVEAFLNR